MSLDTYDNLKTAILTKLRRTNDSAAVSNVTNWVTLAEDELRLAFRDIKVSDGEEIDTAFTISSEYTDLPDDFIGIRLVVDGSGNSLDYITPQVLSEAYTPTTGTPKYYTIQGNKLRVYPSPDSSSDYTLTYYKLPSLSDTVQTNWLLTAHPKVYWRAVLSEAYEWYDMGDKVVASNQDRDRLLSRLYTTGSASVLAGALTISRQGETP